MNESHTFWKTERASERESERDRGHLSSGSEKEKHRKEKNHTQKERESRSLEIRGCNVNDRHTFLTREPACTSWLVGCSIACLAGLPEITKKTQDARHALKLRGNFAEVLQKLGNRNLLATGLAQRKFFAQPTKAEQAGNQYQATNQAAKLPSKEARSQARLCPPNASLQRARKQSKPLPASKSSAHTSPKIEKHPPWGSSGYEPCALPTELGGLLS